MKYAERFMNAKRIVVKVGTSTLAYSGGSINIRRTEELVRVLSDLQNSGREIILVTSAAIGVGTAKLRLKSRPTDTPGRQAAAAVGQCELMYLYDQLFTKHNHIAAQVLLTRDEVDEPVRRQHVINTLERLIEFRVIPIINENDTVSVEELELGENNVFGDNDTLSAIVAALVEADALALLSDIDGLYQEDPKRNPDASIIPLVTEIDEYIESIAGGTQSEHAKGGMATKISAARIALERGVDMALINGEHPSLLYDLFDGSIEKATFFCKE